MEMVLRVSGFHLDQSSRARHDRARHILSTTGVRYTECTVNKACAPFPDGHDGGELPQLCSQDEAGALTVVGGMDAIDRLNDAGTLRAECEAFKATKRLEYEARSGTARGGSRSPRAGAPEATASREARVRALEETERGLRRALDELKHESAVLKQETSLLKQDAVRAAEQTNAELDALERGAARLERKLALASRALESSTGLVSALTALALEGVAVAP